MGVACARRLAARGQLLLSDVAERRLAEAAARLASEGASVRTAVVDVADPSAVRSLADEAARLGPLAGLIHTAGLSPTMADWRRIIEVDLVGTARLLEAFLPLARQGSVAVCVASIAGHLPQPAEPAVLSALDSPLAADLMERIAPFFEGRADASNAAYGLAKQAVIRLVERQAPAWGRRGARIVSLSPGIIRTPMAEQEFKVQPQMQQMVQVTPLGRIGEPEEIAAVVEFLCSEGASYITGCDLRVDGGVTAVLRHMA